MASNIHTCVKGGRLQDAIPVKTTSNTHKGMKQWTSAICAACRIGENYPDMRQKVEDQQDGRPVERANVSYAGVVR